MGLAFNISYKYAYGKIVLCWIFYVCVTFVLRFYVLRSCIQGRAEKIRAPPQPLGLGNPGPLANGLGGLGPLVNGIGRPGPFSLWPQGLRGPLAYGFRGSGPLEYG